MVTSTIARVYRTLADNAGLPISATNGLPTTNVASVGGGITPTDRGITNATGASQQIVAANAVRKALVFKNGPNITGVNIYGGTAIIGGAGTKTLQAYEPYVLEGPACPLGAVTIITTAAGNIACDEYT